MVFVLSHDGQPLDPTIPARARKLLKAGRAAIWRRFPFTIRLRQHTGAESVTHNHRAKLDPGSQTTGIAIVQEATGRIVWAAELSIAGKLFGTRCWRAGRSDGRAGGGTPAIALPASPTVAERTAGSRPACCTGC
jgi:hypothetical protein